MATPEEVAARAPEMTPDQAGQIRRMFKYIEPEAKADDSDLVYDGRARKRPSGASDLTQRIYMMLDEHPEGLSRSAIFVALHKGWLDTDYYRAYEQYLAEQRKSYSHVVPRRRIKVEYGSDEFKMRAQRWAISRTLGSMKKLGTVHRDGDLWRKGKRAPRITVQESKPRYVTHDWAAERRNAYRASTNAAVRREEIKAELWTALSDGRLKGRARQVIQHAYDYLSGG